MKLLAVVLPALLCVGCTTKPEPVASTHPAKPHSELVFRGTVIKIEGPTTDFFQPWVITTRVDKLLSGSFSGKQFQFAVHSPAQSNLDIGKQYTIRAVRTETGYTVDELQWLKSPSPKTP
jgi:hypothetical protein